MESVKAQTTGGGVQCALIILLDGDLVYQPEHMGVSYLVSVLRKAGYSCAIVEVDPDDEDYTDRLSALSPVIVGISLTSVNLERVKKVGKAVRDRLGVDVHICAGGPVATFVGPELLNLPGWEFLDSLVRGEAELVIGALVASVMAKDSTCAIPGVTRRGGPSQPLMSNAVDNLDTLPWPARDQLSGFRGRMSVARICTSRGCTSRCTFCNAPHAGNNIAKAKVWRGRSPEDVVAEMEDVYRRYGVNTFEIVDSTFEDPGPTGKARIGHFANLLIERGLPIFYNTCSQAKNWRTAEDLALLSRLVESGLERTLLGIEAGSDRMLKILKKPSTRRDNEDALDMFRQAGVYVSFGFIMLHPYAVWSDLEQNVELLVKYSGHNWTKFVTRLQIYPGAEVVDQLSRDGLLEANYWQTLNPLGYRFADPEVRAMCNALESLYLGGMSLWRNSMPFQSSVFEFEVVDAATHNFVARARSLSRDNADALASIAEGDELLQSERKALTVFNVATFDQVAESVRGTMALDAGLPIQLEQRYRKAIDTFKATKLRLGRRLIRHHGVDLMHMA